MHGAKKLWRGDQLSPARREKKSSNAAYTELRRSMGRHPEAAPSCRRRARASETCACSSTSVWACCRKVRAQSPEHAINTGKRRLRAPLQQSPPQLQSLASRQVPGRRVLCVVGNLRRLGPSASRPASSLQATMAVWSRQRGTRSPPRAAYESHVALQPARRPALSKRSRLPPPPASATI